MATPDLKAWAIGQPRQAQESKVGFYLVLASLLFEFGRPQELIPGLRVIPFGTAHGAAVYAGAILAIDRELVRDVRRIVTQLARTRYRQIGPAEAACG